MALESTRDSAADVLAALLGWLEAEQRDVIAFLREENRVLKAQLGGRRLRWTTISAAVSRSWGNASDAACCERSRRS